MIFRGSPPSENILYFFKNLDLFLTHSTKKKKNIRHLIQCAQNPVHTIKKTVSRLLPRVNRLTGTSAPTQTSPITIEECKYMFLMVSSTASCLLLVIIFCFHQLTHCCFQKVGCQCWLFSVRL